MTYKSFWGSLLLFAILLMFTNHIFANDLKSTYKHIESLKLGRQGYTLGAKLTKNQMTFAKRNQLENETPGTLKFKDQDLNIIVQEKNKRVIVIYQEFKQATLEKLQKTVGELYLDFDDPTVMAHDKIVYWAYSKKGKISSQEFDAAKENNKKLDVLATIKFVSEANILDKENNSQRCDGYFIISSSFVLQKI